MLSYPSLTWSQYAALSWGRYRSLPWVASEPQYTVTLLATSSFTSNDKTRAAHYGSVAASDQWAAYRASQTYGTTAHSDDYSTTLKTQKEK